MRGSNVIIIEALFSQTQQPVARIEPVPPDHETSTDPLCHCADWTYDIGSLRQRTMLRILPPTTLISFMLLGNMLEIMHIFLLFLLFFYLFEIASVNNVN